MLGSGRNDAAMRLQRMLTGRYDIGPGSASSYPKEAFVLPGAKAAVLESLDLPSTSLTFVPEELAGLVSSQGDIAVYTGSLDFVGDELALSSGLSVASFAYATGAYVPITGPTLFTIHSTEDVADFLSDADDAVNESVFRQHLFHPYVSFADECALSPSATCASASGARVFVGKDGSTQPSYFGGTAERCVPEATARSELQQGTSERPWLGRYLAVLGVMRRVSTRHVKEIPVVSGFGYRTTQGTLSKLPTERADAPIVLFDGSVHLVANPVTGQVLKAPPEAATIVEFMFGTSSRTEAIEAISSVFGVSLDQAVQSCETVQAQVLRNQQPWDESG